MAKNKISLASKLGYIAGNIIAGCFLTSLALFSVWLVVYMIKLIINLF